MSAFSSHSPSPRLRQRTFRRKRHDIFIHGGVIRHSVISGLVAARVYLLRLSFTGGLFLSFSLLQESLPASACAEEADPPTPPSSSLFSSPLAVPPVGSLHSAQQAARQMAEQVTQQAGLTGRNISPLPALPQKAIIRTVLNAALDFMIPRMLSPHTAQDLCLWGLSGFSTLDPALRFHQEKTKTSNILVLTYGKMVIMRQNLPSTQDKKDYNGAWATLSATMMEAAWQQSDILRNLHPAQGKTPSVQNAVPNAAPPNTENNIAPNGAGDDSAEGLLNIFFDEMFNHLDAYSRYLGPQAAHSEREYRQGEDCSIGLRLETQKNKPPIISSINISSPAWEQGIDIGQTVLEINGNITRHASLHTLMQWLSGPPGSKVTLKLGLPAGKTKTSILTRQILPPETVFPEHIGRYTALKIERFSTQTAEEISQYLSAAMPDPPPSARKKKAEDAESPFEDAPTGQLSGIILDLRGNRGGVLQQAVITAALFLDSGIAATTEGRNPASNHIWAVQGGDITNGSPLVVLVDGRTASAAEILAAALSDRQRAVVIGSSTLGKGLVQIIGQMPNGGEVLVTWSHNQAPLGWPIQGLGVMPQICTSRGKLSVEEQLRALRQGQSLQADFLHQSRAVRASASIDQLLEIRQNCPASIGSPLDIYAAQHLLASAKAYQTALHSIAHNPATMPIPAVPPLH